MAVLTGKIVSSVESRSRSPCGRKYARWVASGSVTVRHFLHASLVAAGNW